MGTGIEWYPVLGPLLFLIFVNDIDSNIRSILLKFADDTKVFAKVNSVAERQQLQDNLNTVNCATGRRHGKWSSASPSV